MGSAERLSAASVWLVKQPLTALMLRKEQTILKGIKQLYYYGERANIKTGAIRLG